MNEARFDYLLAPQPGLLSVSEGVETLLGHGLRRWLAGEVHLPALIHPDDADIAQQLFDPSLAVPNGVVNLRVRQANGRIRCVRGEFHRTITQNPEGVRLSLLLQDAKGLPRTLDDAATTLNFRAMMEITDDFIYFKDRNHVFTGASQTLVSLCDPAQHWTDLLGQTDYDVFPEALADHYYRLEKQVFSGQPLAHEVQVIQSKDGQNGWVDNRKYPIHNPQGQIIGLFGIARDITSLKQAELELRAHRSQLEAEVASRQQDLQQAKAQIRTNEQRYGFALEAAHDGIWDWDMRTGKAYVNPGYCTMLGYEPGELGDHMQGQFIDLLHPDDKAVLSSNTRRLLEENGGHEQEFRLRCKDGSYKWVLSRGKVVERDEAQRAVRAVGTHIDLSDRKRLEEVTLASALYTRSLIEASLDPLVTISPEGKITDVNTATEHVTGVPRQQLIDSDFASYFTDPDQARRGYQTVFSQGFVTDYPLAIRSQTGQVVEVLYNASLYRSVDGQVRGVFAAARDITVQKKALAELEEHRQHLERLVSARTAELAQKLRETTELNRKLEESQSQLLQSEKMASIGQLAAGVAHEINNPLGFVSSNLGTLEGYLRDLFEIMTAYEALESGACGTCGPLDALRQLKAVKDYDYLRSDTTQLLSESREGLMRVAKIVRDLKSFSRTEETVLQWSDLHAGLDSTLNIVWNELKYKCTLAKHYGELPMVLCVPGQINQVFMNLLVNASQAIAEKGTITLTSGTRDHEVFVTVTDTGCGIPAESLNRIFEPFFTTKPVGKGTGLGLSLSYGIVRKHGGRIDVSSTLGQGSAFTVWLPIRGPETPSN